MTAEAYADLIAGLYAPAPPPTGIERICRELARMDVFIEQQIEQADLLLNAAHCLEVEARVEAFYRDEYPKLQLEWSRLPTPGRCEAEYARATPGESDTCSEDAVVCAIGTGAAFCRACARICEGLEVTR